MQKVKQTQTGTLIPGLSLTGKRTGKITVKIIAAFTLASTLAAGMALAATIEVPFEQLTIQDGIDAATDGDTVLVSPGAYAEEIDFLGKLIVVRSLDGPVNTLITGAGSDTLVFFGNGETAEAVLDGFTLQGGWYAIRCANASPTS